MTGDDSIRLRRIFAGLAGLVASGGLFATVRNEWVIGVAPAALLVAAALVVHVRSFGAQLLARAAWWSNLTLGVVIALIGSGHERPPGTLMAVAAGAALLLVDRKGLADARERAAYLPASFRSWLLLLMVLALADAQTFLVFAVASLTSSSHGTDAVWLTAGTVAFIVGFVGLYRLRVWGAIVNVVASALLGAALFFRVLGPNSETRAFLLLLCAAQVLAGGALLAMLATKVRLPSAPARVRSFGTGALVAGLMLASLVSYVMQMH